MVSSRDSHIIELWLAKQSSQHTRNCYRCDVQRTLSYSTKPLTDIVLADLQRFSQSLIEAGLAPVSRARTLAAIKSLFGFLPADAVHRGEPGCRARPAELRKPPGRAHCGRIRRPTASGSRGLCSRPRSACPALRRWIARLRSLRAAVAERTSAWGFGPNYRVRQERTDALNRPEYGHLAATGVITRNCGTGSARVPFSERKEA